MNIPERVAQAIGSVCMRWVLIEYLCHDLILHFAQAAYSAYDDHSVLNVLHCSTANIDTRGKCSVIKILAHNLESDLSPGLYDKTSELMNFMDNVLRVERNRFVHDFWSTEEDGMITRSYFDMKIVKTSPQSRLLSSFTEKQYGTVEEIEAFGAAINDFYDDLVTLDNHLAWMANQKEQPSEFLQPLPATWKSCAHRERLVQGMPKLR